jgi:hypothetical protein
MRNHLQATNLSSTPRGIYDPNAISSWINHNGRTVAVIRAGTFYFDWMINNPSIAEQILARRNDDLKISIALDSRVHSCLESWQTINLTSWIGSEIDYINVGRHGISSINE